jgi:hypothetical protein
MSDCLTFDVGTRNVSLPAGVKIYPNPAHGVLNVETPTSSDYRVHNTLGQSILGGSKPEGKTAIDIRPLAAGVYFLTLTTQGSETVTRIIVR